MVNLANLSKSVFSPTFLNLIRALHPSPEPSTERTSPTPNRSCSIILPTESGAEEDDDAGAWEESGSALDSVEILCRFRGRKSRFARPLLEETDSCSDSKSLEELRVSKWRSDVAGVRGWNLRPEVKGCSIES